MLYMRKNLYAHSLWNMPYRQVVLFEKTLDYVYFHFDNSIGTSFSFVYAFASSAIQAYMKVAYLRL